MSKVSLLSLAALLGVGLSPVLRAEPPARPLTQAELLKTLDDLSKGDANTKAPLSAEPALPKRDAPTAKPATVKTTATAAPRSPRNATTGPTGEGPAPKSDPAKPKEKEKKPMPGSTPGQTEITSEEGAFDQKTHQAIFTIKVFVRNPDFTLSCDKLTAYMKHDEEKSKPGGATPALGAPAAPARLGPPIVEANGANVTGKPAKGDAGSGPAGGLDRAIAESNVEIIQDKVADDGSISHNVGHGKKAIYESSTGNVTLYGMPDVQQGINSCVALDEKTIIILNRDGHMTTIGPTKNIIREANAATPAPKPAQTATTTANGR